MADANLETTEGTESIIQDQIAPQETEAIASEEVCEPLAAQETAEDAQATSEEESSEPDHELTPEELEAQEAERLAAEKAEREAQERLERMEAEKEAAAELSEAAVAKIGTGAGFVTSAGTYYDVNAPKRVEYQYADIINRPVSAEEEPEAQKAEESAEEEQEAPAIPQEPEDTYEDPREFARKVARLTESVTKQSLHREIFYKTLVFCRDESRTLHEIEEKIATFAEFKRAAASQYHFIKVLEEAGGLERFELDENGEVILPEQKVGLTEDEIDDLVYDYSFMTTNVGSAVVEQHTPRARIIELLGLVPERKDAYIELMDFVSEDPRTYNEISQLFQGRDVLYRLDADGEPQKMQPSVFVDKLEAAGGIEYRDGWVLTEEGRDFLEELRGSKDA